MGTKRTKWDDEWVCERSERDGKRRKGGRMGPRNSGHLSRADKFEKSNEGKCPSPDKGMPSAPFTRNTPDEVEDEQSILRYEDSFDYYDFECDRDNW